MAPGSLVILSDRVDRVDELARRCKELELDGILVDTISLDSAGPTVALPRIGMANKRHRISQDGGFVLIRLDGKTSPKMLVIARSAGIDAVVSPELDSSDLDFDSRFRGILREMGLSSISSTNRSNIRALDHNVAMQTGLRLVGLERPLPTWTRGIEIPTIKLQHSQLSDIQNSMGTSTMPRDGSQTYPKLEWLSKIQMIRRSKSRSFRIGLTCYHMRTYQGQQGHFRERRCPL